MRNHTHGIKGFLNRKSVWLKLGKWAYRFLLRKNMSPCKQLMKELQALLFIDLSKVLSNFVQNNVFIPSDSIIFFLKSL